MTITLSSDQESLIYKQLQAGRFQSVDAVIDSALKALAEQDSSVQTGQQPSGAGQPKKNFTQFLMESPLRGSELNLERAKDYPRPVEL
jgi:Arc/MetJ-type ribon-helix-helix transcriptional regulator